MCGIIAYTEYRKVYTLLISSLHCLEYRGYDYAGVTLIDSQ